MTTVKVHPADRRDQILSLVGIEGSVQVSEVAERLGVAPITVRRDIAELARQGRLEQVHGGARRAHARPLPRTMGSATVGVVTPSLDFYWPTIIEGANRAADERGIRLLLRGSTFAAQDNLTQIRALVSESAVDALLLVPDLEGPHSDELIEYLETVETPTVLVERSLRPRGARTRTFDAVSTNHADGAQLAVRHLTALGHRRIALLTDKRVPQRHQIAAGWHEALEGWDADLASPRGDTSRLDGRARVGAIDDFVRECVGFAVTAILVHSDEAALVVLELLRGLGVRVPEQMSVITYDDELATLARPALTAVAPPKQELGARAVQMLAHRLLAPASPLARVQLDPTLIVRGSTGPAPV